MVRNNTARCKVLVAASIAHRAPLAGIARYARENGWHLVTDMVFTGTFPQGWQGDGVLALGAHDPELMAQIRDLNLPCVTTPRTIEPTEFPCIEEDHILIGRIAADHFLDRAYRSYAWAPLIDDDANYERFLGFQGRLVEHAFKCHVLPPALTRVGSQWQSRWSEYRQRLAVELQRLPRPTAIFAFNDCVAANLIDACRDSGFSVPEEFAILGVDNNPIVVDSVPVSLSSVEPDHEEMGYRAAAALDALMNGEAPPAEVTPVPPKGVITRVSTDSRAVANPRVAQALAYIAENYHNPMLGVLDVASAVGLSRRHLERTLREVTGHTVKDHIVMARMLEASRLLTTHSRVKCSDVATLVGLGGGRNFFRTFRRYFGTSPKEHRESAAGETGLRSLAVSENESVTPMTASACGKAEGACV